MKAAFATHESFDLWKVIIIFSFHLPQIQQCPSLAPNIIQESTSYRWRPPKTKSLLPTNKTIHRTEQNNSTKKKNEKKSVIWNWLLNGRRFRRSTANMSSVGSLVNNAKYANGANSTDKMDFWM